MNIHEISEEENEKLNIKMALSLIHMLYMKNYISKAEYLTSVKCAERKLKEVK